MADNFGAGKAAINTTGRLDDRPVHRATRASKTGIAPTPKGPEGKRASMFNGLADSVWAGTKNPAASVKWVEYLASTACQDVVASKARRLPGAHQPPPTRPPKPSRPRASTSPPSPPTSRTGTTFLFPIADNAAKVDGIMKPAMDAVLSGKKPASSLTEANDQVNALFKSKRSKPQPPATAAPGARDPRAGIPRTST